MPAKPLARPPLAAIALLACIATLPTRADDALPIVDVHVHYSHDSLERTPPERVVKLMRDAGLAFALVSSSDDSGTQRLRQLAPELIVPGLRPYSRRGQSSSWFTSAGNLAYVESLVERHRYATIGEFHLYGDSADLPIPRRIVELADEHNLILHAHSDADAVTRLLAQSPTVRVIWAHAGFARPEEIGEMLGRHDRLWADLAFRSDVGAGGELADEWTALFAAHPDRLMLGTDTYTPERIHFIPLHAASARDWLTDLPDELAERVAWRNASDLLLPVWEANRDDGAALVDDLCAVPAAVGETTLEQDDLTVRLLPLDDIVVSEPLAIRMIVCGPGAADAVATLDAGMPAHGHGMNYAPEHGVVARSDTGQRVRVDGIVLHMPGDWRWSVDVRSGETRRTLTGDFTVR